MKCVFRFLYYFYLKLFSLQEEFSKIFHKHSYVFKYSSSHICQILVKLEFSQQLVIEV